MNVALRLKSMGVESSIITRIGDDDLGNEVNIYIKDQGLPGNLIQVDNEHKTGEVIVTLDEFGTASYEISKPVAWDFIEITEEALADVSSSDAIIFGTLASRSNLSRKTLFRLLEVAKFKVLDVNLRPPDYNKQLLSNLLSKADFIKLNDEELDEICDKLNIKEISLEDKVKALADYSDTDQFCITKGGKGATLFYKNKFYHNHGYKIKVVDTVGAGDSFLATLISELLQGSKPQQSIDYACAVGAMVAGSAGANPNFTKEEIENFIQNRL